ncbi:cryptochrome/photolyase family protein [Actinacidiphila glaucinigra]|uniref:cryptochrome/photolyase family protein n=1 Tax=Actinacidiphila glaucinigra TaxID=235986 RepID=UPI0036E94311
MHVAVVLFTSDLRLHDHPPLSAAVRSNSFVVPLFVRDAGISAVGFDAPNRRAFLADCLQDLDQGLRKRGGRLILRTGEVVEQVCKVVADAEADEVHMAAGASAYARAREERLRRALEREGTRLYVHEAVTTALAPGAVTPSGSDHFAVFTAYFRRWSQRDIRTTLAAPRTVQVPLGTHSEKLPERKDVTGVSPGLASGGEEEGRRALASWWGNGIAQYAERHDGLAADATSRLSAHLHFGTLAAAELVHRARSTGGEGAEAYVRQLCWRDFHHQVLAARPLTAVADYRTRGDRWRSEGAAEEDLQAWKEGRTGYPLVDAAMRQLRHEGWMHNRGRLITASFLTKTLYIDWRVGARYFLEWLVDGDVANNQLNWQWIAGTGTDTRPNRVLNPVRQGLRYDAEGAYVRRWVPELEGLEGSGVHQPWKLPEARRALCDYPDPVVGLAEGLERFRLGRGLK